MDQFSRALVESVAAVFETPEPVVEIGSFQVEGQEALSNLRLLFPGKEFIGCDLRPGPGVDRIENLEHLDFPDSSVGTLLVLNVFEHAWNLQFCAREIFRVVKPGGIAVVSTVFHFHLHEHPGDYWRVSPQALARLLEPFPYLLFGYQGYRTTPRAVFAVGLKAEHLENFSQSAQHFETSLRQRGKRKFPPGRMLRYSLGSFLFGRRPFRDWLSFNELEVKKRSPI